MKLILRKVFRNLNFKKNIFKKYNINIDIYNNKISYRRPSIILRKYFEILLNSTCPEHQDFRLYKDLYICCCNIKHNTRFFLSSFFLQHITLFLLFLQYVNYMINIYDILEYLYTLILFFEYSLVS